MHKVVAEVVWVNPDEEGTIYPTGKDDANSPKPIWSLSKKTLVKLARAAGISWDSIQSRRMDNGSDPEMVRYLKACRINEIDGSVRSVQEPYALDLKARADEIYEAKCDKWFWLRGEGQRRNVENRIQKNADDAKKDNRNPWSADFCKKLLAEVVVYDEDDKEKWAREQTRIEMIQKRKFAEQLAASGAESRCILTALALSRGGYMLHDLQTKPFVILKLVPNIDYEHDIDARRLLVMRHTGLIDMAFGYGQTMAGFTGLPQADARQISSPVTPAIIAANATSEEEQSAQDAEIAEIEAEIGMDPDVPAKGELFATNQVTDKNTGDYVTDGTANPTVDEFSEWPRVAQVALLRTLGEQVKNLPKIQLDEAKDAGLIRYYDVALRFIGQSAARK
jgi:hypothetical protein